MNREIKVRAWDKPNKQMRGPWEVWYIPENMNFELMQFTGLNDKNGKEIYEGDIVEMNGWVAQIVWSGFTSSFMYEKPAKRSGNVDDFLWQSYAGMKVIGNIMENPELLKV